MDEYMKQYVFHIYGGISHVHDRRYFCPCITIIMVETVDNNVSDGD